MDPRACLSPELLPPFAEVVEKVRIGHPEGLDQLYRVFRILSGALRRQIGFQDFEDRLHDIFLMVVQSIREGKLREPGALPSYIHGIARLSNCSSIGVRARRRRLTGSLRAWSIERCGRETPEDQMVQKQRVQLMRDLLAALGEREREILTRFYLWEQTKEQICQDLNISDTQFRLTKSRAKQRLSRIGSQVLNPVQQAA